MNHLSLVLATLVLVTSCATYSYQPVVASSAPKDEITVSALLLQGLDWRLEVNVTNGSSHSISADGAQFRLYAGDKKTWTPVRIIPNSEVYRWAADNASRPSAVIVSQDSPTYQRTTTTTIGGGSLSVTRIERRPVPSTTQVYMVTPDSQERLARLKESLFFPVTLEPGQTRTGLIYTDSSRAPYLKLVVPVDGREYEVLFERVKVPGVFTNLN